MQYRYLDDFPCGISVFAIFSCGIAVLGTPQCPPPFAITTSNINGWQHNGIFHSVILGNVYESWHYTRMFSNY